MWTKVLLAAMVVLVAHASEENRDMSETVPDGVVECRTRRYVLRLTGADKAPMSDTGVEVRQVASPFFWGVEAGPGRMDLEPAFNAVVLPQMGNAEDGEVAAALLRGCLVQGPAFAAGTPADTIREEVGGWAGAVKIWVISDSVVASGISPEEVSLAAQTAREANPEALLLIRGEVGNQPGAAQELAAFARQCVECGTDIDGLAVQVTDGAVWRDADALRGMVAHLGEGIKPLYLYGVPAKQAVDVAPVLFAMPQVAGVFFEGGTGEVPDEFRTLVLRTWRTALSLRTDESGKAAFRGFFGDYEVTAGGHTWWVRLTDNGDSEIGLHRPPTVEPPARYQDPFTAETADKARAWQTKIRARLAEIVAQQNPKNGHPLDVELSEPVAKDAFVQRDLVFTGNNGERIECTFTVPPGEGPFPAMVCLHGHGGDRFKVHAEGPPFNGLADGYARRGYVTIAPSLDHREYAPNQLWNLMRLVDVLETFDFVDVQRIGAAGLSMGGEWTMWLSAMDERVKAAVVSGWLCTTEGVLSIFNCPCWMPPGLLELCNIAEVHILIAPRPLLFESAVSDNCFPIPATEEAYRKVLRGYEVLGAPLAVRQHTFPGGHAWNGGVAYEFIGRALKEGR